MEFLKIQITKKNTLNVTLKDDACNIVTVVGGNIVHKDLKTCMNALIPHLSLLTEQREAENRTLKELENDRLQDGNSRSVFKRMTVDTLTLSEDECNVVMSGQRILQNGMIIKVESPQIGTADGERYDYCSELFMAVNAVIYEAKQYWEEKKWGIKEGDLDFAAEDPFEGKVATGDVPDAGAPKKRGRKSKKEEAA